MLCFYPGTRSVNYALPHGASNIFFFLFSPLGLKRPIEISGPAGCSIAQLQNHCQERIASFTYNIIIFTLRTPSPTLVHICNERFALHYCKYTFGSESVLSTSHS
jgi:hypothetical protein